MMIRTQVYLPEELHREAKLFARKKRMNYSTLVRKGVAEIIKKGKKAHRKKNDWEDFIGALKYGPKDLSNHVDDIYK